MQPGSEKVSEESRKFLQDVKKGRSRKFVMFKDGVQIDQLFVFKAGSFDKVIRSARQDGAGGDVYWGTLNGDGTDIRFELSKSDGFVTPPGTEQRLKEFLREATGLKFEPTYAIVEKAPAGEDADAHEEEDASESTASADSSAASSVATERDEDKFVRLLKAILPHVKKALAVPSSLSDDLQAAVREAQAFGKQREFEPGMAALRKVGDLTKRALVEVESAAAGRTESPKEATRSKNARRQKWGERLADVQPRYAAAIRSSVANSNDLQKVMYYAVNQARQQKFVKALVGLDRLEQMLNG